MLVLHLIYQISIVKMLILIIHLLKSAAHAASTTEWYSWTMTLMHSLLTDGTSKSNFYKLMVLVQLLGQTAGHPQTTPQRLQAYLQWFKTNPLLMVLIQKYNVIQWTLTLPTAYDNSTNYLFYTVPAGEVLGNIFAGTSYGLCLKA